MSQPTNKTKEMDSIILHSFFLKIIELDSLILQLEAKQELITKELKNLNHEIHPSIIFDELMKYRKILYDLTSDKNSSINNIIKKFSTSEKGLYYLAQTN